mmetsp:Transcript_93195/g.301329  ORF Transcript_93195/g.301329 Transcript_93195/m.301329 type:complete len:245 (+) Transcript_93195:1367-2101(+)
MKTHRVIDDKETSFMLCISWTMTSNKEAKAGPFILTPPMLSARRSFKICFRSDWTASSNPLVCIGGIAKNFFSKNESEIVCRTSLRPGSVCSWFKALSSVSSLYFQVFLLTTKINLWEGNSWSSSNLMRLRAASEAPRFCKPASLKEPPQTKTTSVPITMPKTLTKVRMAAIALLPPSQSIMSMCICSCLSSESFPASAALPTSGHSNINLSMLQITASMPSVTGSGESLETKVSSKLRNLEAR